MPIYEYKCESCQEVMEFIQKFSDAPKTDCKICGARSSLKKMVSSPAIQFKGEGWYLTDYSDKGKKVKAEAKKESSDAKAPKPEKKKEKVPKAS
jgi:putative FmdB family regulatory protein